MEKHPMKNDARKEKRRRTFGDPIEQCLVCGVRNPEEADELGVNLLERHHLAGRKLEPDLTVVVCKPCHEVLQEGLRDAGLEELIPDSSLERTGGLCLGLADLFEVLIGVLRNRGRELFRLREDLDSMVEAGTASDPATKDDPGP